MAREQRPDGTVRIADERCSFTFWRPRPGVVLLRIEGIDQGQFGSLPQDELRGDVVRYAPIELFVETGGGVMTPSPLVQEQWAEWFRDNRPALKAIHFLAGGKYLQFTAEVVKLFSRTGDLMRVYLDRAAFEEALQRSAPGFRV
jgi:hypothetical protein